MITPCLYNPRTKRCGRTKYHTDKSPPCIEKKNIIRSCKRKLQKIDIKKIKCTPKL